MEDALSLLSRHGSLSSFAQSLFRFFHKPSNPLFVISSPLSIHCFDISGLFSLGEGSELKAKRDSLTLTSSLAGSNPVAYGLPPYTIECGLARHICQIP